MTRRTATKSILRNGRSAHKRRLPRNFSEEPAYSRGDGFFNPHLHNPRIVLVGAGGIGGWVGMQLSKMGVRRITIWDDDLVARHNLSNTPYQESDRKKSKAEALAKLMMHMNKDAKVKVVSKRYRGQKLGKPDILIAAVDSMEARKLLFDQAVEQKVPMFIDGRIGGELLRVYSLQPTLEEDRLLYEDPSIWAPDKDIPPLPCSMQQTIYVGNLIAARITHAVQRWVTREEYTQEIVETLNPISLTHSPARFKDET